MAQSLKTFLCGFVLRKETIRALIMHKNNVFFSMHICRNNFGCKNQKINVEFDLIKWSLKRRKPLKKMYLFFATFSSKVFFFFPQFIYLIYNFRFFTSIKYKCRNAKRRSWLNHSTLFYADCFTLRNYLCCNNAEK